MRIREKTKSNIESPESFRVNRGNWVMGEFDKQLGKARMLNRRGNMCCLGFYSYACGVGAEHLRDRADPDEVVHGSQRKVFPFEELPYLTKDGTAHGTQLSFDAVTINDDEKLTLRGREEKLTKLFDKHGIGIEFVGKYPKDVVEADKARRQEVLPNVE
jgi:hypothetical protein